MKFNDIKAQPKRKTFFTEDVNADLKQLVQQGKEKGFVSKSELTSILGDSSEDDVKQISGMLANMGINVVDSASQDDNMDFDEVEGEPQEDNRPNQGKDLGLTSDDSYVAITQKDINTIMQTLYNLREQVMAMSKERTNFYIDDSGDIQRFGGEEE